MRINVIDPRYLADQHLVAEYRELKMLPKSLLRSLRSKNGIDLKKIPKSYTLNKGHGYFFYDKVTFIINRFEIIKEEMNRRGFQCNYIELPLAGIPDIYFGDYEVTKEAIQINLERIRLRIDGKHSWFKFMRGPMSRYDWDQLYLKFCKQEGIEFETIDEIKNNPIEDNINLKIYVPGSGHYSNKGN